MKKYGSKLTEDGLDLMSGLLIMDPKDRLTAKQALMHPFFDGLRTAQEEEMILKERERIIKRVDSSTNPRTGTMSRNGDQSRSRSGLRNNKVVKNGNRSLGRKPTDKNAVLQMPYGQSSNIRDSSVSNNSNPAGSSSLAAYTSGQQKKFAGNQNSGAQFNMMNNFMSNNLPQTTFYN